MLQPSNPNGGKQMMDNYDILTPDQLRMGAVKMRYELDNLYKVSPTPHKLTPCRISHIAGDTYQACRACQAGQYQLCTCISLTFKSHTSTHWLPLQNMAGAA